PPPPRSPRSLRDALPIFPCGEARPRLGGRALDRLARGPRRRVGYAEALPVRGEHRADAFGRGRAVAGHDLDEAGPGALALAGARDRKSTRLNSSHVKHTY